MEILYNNLVQQVNYGENENILEWTMAQFKGRDKTIDMSLQKNGALILTNQRVIFKGGVILGHGFQDEISLPFQYITDVSSERKLLKNNYYKLLIIRWNTDQGQNSAVFYPTDSKTHRGSMMRTVSNFKPGERSPAEVWKEKIKSMIYPNSDNNLPHHQRRSPQNPPPPSDFQKNEPTSSQGQPSSLECSNCGEEAQQDMKFCPYCGSDLEKACDNCGMELEENWKFCPNCRNEL